MEYYFLEHIREWLSLFVPIVLWVLNVSYRDRPRLTHSVRHLYTYLIDQPLQDEEGKIIRAKQTVQVASLSIFNEGRESAKNIEIVFNWEPPFINFWPTRFYEKKMAADGRCSFFFQNLAPKDVLGIELMAINAEVPQVTSIRSEQSVAAEVPLTPQPVVARYIVWLRTWFVLAGIGMTIYLGVSLIKVISSH